MHLKKLQKLKFIRNILKFKESEIKILPCQLTEAEVLKLLKLEVKQNKAK